MRRLSAPILASGAVLEVYVGVSDPRRRTMVRQGRPVPPSVHLSLLVDTGASMTLIDDAIMRSLQLPPTGSARYHTSSTNGVAQHCDQYDVSLVLGGLATPNTLTVDPLAVIGVPFINHPFDGLLGRDVLSRVQMSWNGPTQVLELVYP